MKISQLKSLIKESIKEVLKENSPLDPKLAGYWVMKDKNYAISMYPSKQEAEIA
jgi:hypothetical protein